MLLLLLTDVCYCSIIIIIISWTVFVQMTRCKRDESKGLSRVESSRVKSNRAVQAVSTNNTSQTTTTVSDLESTSTLVYVCILCSGILFLLLLVGSPPSYNFSLGTDVPHAKKKTKGCYAMVEWRLLLLLLVVVLRLLYEPFTASDDSSAGNRLGRLVKKKGLVFGCGRRRWISLCLSPRTDPTQSGLGSFRVWFVRTILAWSSHRIVSFSGWNPIKIGAR